VRGRASQIRPEALPPTATSGPAPVSSWGQQTPKANPRTPSIVGPGRSISNHLFRGTHGPNTPTSTTSLWAPRASPTASTRELA
jgi:hypothetical protein